MNLNHCLILFYLCFELDQADYGEQILGLVSGSLVVGHVQLVVVADLEGSVLYSSVLLATVVNCGG